MAATKTPRAARRTEPAARQGAAAAMNVEFLPEAAPHRRAAPALVSPREDDFDAWLRRELGRLYDATLIEPVPEELTRLLGRSPGQTVERDRRRLERSEA